MVNIFSNGDPFDKNVFLSLSCSVTKNVEEVILLLVTKINKYIKHLKVSGRNFKKVIMNSCRLRYQYS